MFPMILPSLIDAFVDQDDFRALPLPDEGTPAPAGPTTGIDVCTAPAFGLPTSIGRALGIEHWWLDSGESEAGLGPLESTPNPLDTTMVDQTGDAATREGAICAPLEQVFPEHADVDPACVEEAMTPGGIHFGTYGLDGICKDAIDSILEMCDPDTSAAP